MRTRRHPSPVPARNDVDAALAAMSADDLRDVVRDLLLELDGKVHGRLMNTLIQRAARSGSGWAPATLSDDEITEVLAFAQAAERAGHADPSEVDEHLRCGSTAFLRKDYLAAHALLGALLRPIGECAIDLGQHETVDEVLGADTGECAAQYVVSAYMLSPPTDRADRVRVAIHHVRGIAHFFEPVREMERVAVEPLPGLGDFLRTWRALIAGMPVDARRSDVDTEKDRWLREVVQRLEGSDGLEKIARSTRRADDLRAWCGSLVNSGNWNAALAAFEVAAGLVTDKDYARGEFLDGAALAAQELGHDNLPAGLERAWRADPSMLRLRRWLGSTGSKVELRKRAAEALEACPKPAARQRALLHVLQGEFELASKLLAAAPSQGWSLGDHPGHLLFPLFTSLLGGDRKSMAPISELHAQRGMDIDEIQLLVSAGDGPRLASPEVEVILKNVGVVASPTLAAKSAMLSAMRKAAEGRLGGVAEQKRRSRYGHAAELVAVCVACDPSPETALWAAALKTEYRRFPALRTELDRALGSS